MVDLKNVLQNPEQYTAELTKRFKNPSLISDLISTYENWKNQQQQLEALRQIKNQFNETVISLQGEEKQAKIQEMKITSDQIKGLESETKELKERIDVILFQIPNLTWSGIPVGKDDEANVETAQFGTQPTFDFEPKNYFDLPVFKRDYLSEKGVEAAGARGYYIRGELAKLQRVLFNYILDGLISNGFDYVIPPILVNEKLLFGTGFFPASQDDVYKVEANDKEYYLVGTSEAPLMFMFENQVFDLDKPKFATAWTSCFRKEAGSYGKDTQGGIRVHQFEKIEMVSICKPEESEQVFDTLTNIFTENMKKLGLYFHHLEVSSGDISSKNYRQVDIEAWFPAQSAFRELSSSSNCIDYQTRNLNIKYTNDLGEKALAHSLNCTGITNRAMFAIMEQFQQADGSVRIPEVLQQKFGSDTLR